MIKIITKLVIEKDGKDPQLLENLFKIGEVKLPRDNITLNEVKFV